MRKTSEELEQIKEKYGLDELWSYSRISSWHTSKYEWFLHYIKHEEPVSESKSAYAPLGNAVHNIIEKLYNGEIKYDEMAISYSDEFDTYTDMFGYVFNKGDSEKNKSVSKKYYADIEHFLKNHQKITDKVFTERFLLVKITDNIYLQGYADAIVKDPDGNYTIVDWKSSSIYRGKTLDEHSAQLVLYAEALKQKGVSGDKIRIAFNFLKYVTVEYQQANGKIKQSNIERYQLGEKLRAKAKTWLKREGLSQEEIEDYLNEMSMTNSIDCLPDSVKEKFVISDCYVYVENQEELFKEVKQDIIDTVSEITDLTEKYNNTYDDKYFWDDDELLKSNSFYLANLSDYSIGQLKPYADWLNRQKQEQDSLNDLLGIGEKIEKNQNKDNSSDEDMDLSWLDDIEV